MEKINKIELHVHLDGSVREKTINELLKNEGVTNKESLHVDNNCHNLKEYLDKFTLPISIMQTKENLTKIAYELVCDLEKDDVIYAEIRFAPMFHTKKGLNYDDIIISVLKGLKKGNIKTNLILCCMRGFSKEDNIKTVEMAKKYNLAVDLAGNEDETEGYRYLFDLVKELNIPYTIHVGEALGSKNIMQALLMGAKRIGHGINYDEKVLEYYLKEKITLEICPTSNIQTKVVNSIKEHPIYELFKKGVLVTINTDNRTISNTNLNKEYQLLLNNFDFTIDDLREMNKNALKASFLNEKDKEELLKLI